VANQIYFGGNFYQCVTVTSAGESPTTTAAKWRLIQIPALLRGVLRQGVYAEVLRIDGQNDKATIETNRFNSQLDDLVRTEANKEKWRDRPSVQTR
jgi:hypothetical protein